MSATEFDLCLGRPLKIHLCFNSSSGVTRLLGSQFNHVRINFSKTGSSMSNYREKGTVASSLFGGLRTDCESKNILNRLAPFNISAGGYPRSSTNLLNKLNSDLP